MSTLKKRTKPKKPVDALAREHSKRHSEATKKGIKGARKAKRATQRACSRGRGKSKAELAKRIFVNVEVVATAASATAKR
tara:strand:+ start:2132 stop:2371 length:240 start_codon:yes stop_codon:yes gene_type:complete